MISWLNDMEADRQNVYDVPLSCHAASDTSAKNFSKGRLTLNLVQLAIHDVELLYDAE